MLELLYIIFVGHRHNWKVIETKPMTIENSRGELDFTVRTLQCEICGNIKIISDKDVIKNG